MNEPEFAIEANSTGVWPWRWSVVLRQTIRRPKVTERRVILRAGGWARTAEIQERRVQAAMEQARLLAGQLTKETT